ncbi:FHA domain-containing protein [Ornithinimicrobium sp. Arc0846-15]|nr:FHA domain-containing protein [Ornithinimicrobium laminariae]
MRPGQSISIGRDSACGLSLKDPSLSRRHALVRASRGGIEVDDLGSTNGIYLDEALVASEAPWKPGQVLTMGANQLHLVPQQRLPLATMATGAGHLEVAIPLRPSPPPSPIELEAPARPTPLTPRPMPILSWAIPLVVATALAAAFRMPMLMLFGLLAPAMMLGTWASERISAKKQSRIDIAEHRSQCASLAHEIRTRARSTVEQMNAAHPSVGVLCLAIDTGPREGLWSGQAKPLTLRVGRGNLATGVTIDGAPWNGTDVPILVRGRVICVVGPAESVRRVGRAMLLQSLLHFSPSQMSIEVEGAHPAWDWVAWCPHHDSCAPEITHISLVDRLDLPTNHPWVRPESAEMVVVLAPEPDAVFDADEVVTVQDSHQISVSTPSHVVAGVPDELGLPQAHQWSQALACLRLSESPAGNKGLPGQVTLADIVPSAASGSDTALRWQHRNSKASAPLGSAAEGVCTLDLAMDGPHALVAGTTGSGKSELLRSWALSMALSHSPDDLVMVLVDYKGGSAFGECAALPHCVGLVTDLDEHLVERALTSLMAEIKRREKLLANYSARDLDAYLAGGKGPPIPRLVIMIDEFRVLAEEVPQFVDGLVRLAALGRSLGLHVILATQRPAGVVTADIRANMNLRIALRLRDATDSYDVIESPEAAALPEGTPGRALIRTGAAAARAVQVAHSGSRRRSAQTQPRTVFLDSLWQPPGSSDGEEGHEEPTEEGNHFVQVCQDAAELLNCATPQTPWLAPLPDLISVEALPERGETEELPWGLVDLPWEQAQVSGMWNPISQGHVGIVGGPRTGRTTWVRTILGHLAVGSRAWGVYCFDYPGGLSVLDQANSCAARVTDGETLRGSRVIKQLGSLLMERQALLASCNATTLAEWESRSRNQLPLVLWVIEGWSQFVEEYSSYDRGAVYAEALRVIREGASLGIVVIVTGDRSLLSGTIAGLLTNTWSLRLSDPMDLLMTGLTRTQVPTRMPPGRAIQISTGLVAQVAVLGASADGADQVAEFKDLLNRDPVNPGPVIPSVIRLPTQLLHPKEPRVDGLAVGVGHDKGETLSLPLPREGLRATVAGPPRSGRSSALRALVASAGAIGLKVVRISGSARDQWSHYEGIIERQGDGLVLVDDAEMLLDSSLEEAILRWAADGQMHRHLVVAADVSATGTIYRGLIPTALRQKCGIALNATTAQEGSPWGVSVPVGDLRCPGRGSVIVGGTCTRVQVYAAS